MKVNFMKSQVMKCNSSDRGGGHIGKVEWRTIGRNGFFRYLGMNEATNGRLKWIDS